MQNIKNFTQTRPTKKQLQRYGALSDRITFLTSEDGQRWDECQALFSDNTVKLMYDSGGVIHSVVDAPVPQRGNTYAVSMFFPLNMSVVEIAVDDYPAGCCTDGTWLFDGERVCQDPELLAATILRQNQKALSVRQSKAAGFAFALQSSAAAGNPRDGDADNLLTLQQYADALRDVDLTVEKPDWPPEPSFIY
jgi:hypothetical protein